MSSTRIAFSYAMDALRSDRRTGEPEFVRAGRYNMPAIMREAVSRACQLRAGGSSWRWRMKLALRGVWARAKAAMAKSDTVSDLPAPVVRSAWIKPYVPATTPRVRTFISGARVRSHGW